MGKPARHKKGSNIFHKPKIKWYKIFWEDDGYLGPEDIVLNDGKIYVGYENGVIKNTDGIFSNTKGRPLGMAFDAKGNLIIADAIQGLISIDINGTINIYLENLTQIIFR